VAEEAERKKQSIIFLPCHRSHVDYVSMQIICYRLGLGLPTVVAGDNLNFPVVGSFLQHAGEYFRFRFVSICLYIQVPCGSEEVLVMMFYILRWFNHI
jgi:glycerol-3-phosphate O-acyltransferase